MASTDLPVPMPPPTAKRPVRTVRHGAELIDDYAWLKAENWEEVMEDPKALPEEIADHLAAENRYTEAVMAAADGLRRTLAEELAMRSPEEESEASEADGPWLYYSRFDPDEELPVLCRRSRDGGAETVLLDCAAEAKGQPSWTLEDAAHSPDHKLLAYAVDPRGSERCTIRIRNIATGKDLPDRIAGTASDIVWSADGRALYYVRLDAQHRPLLACRHVLGTRAQDDQVIYQERDPAFDVSVSKTHSGRFIVIESEGHDTNEVRLIDAAAAQPAAVVVEARSPGHDYSVEHHGEDLIILTNIDGASDGKICRTPVASPGKSSWVEVVAHRSGRSIRDFASFPGHLAWLEAVDGVPRIVVRRWSDGAEHEITFPEQAYHLDLDADHSIGASTVRFTYASMTTPEQTFDYDMETRERRLVEADVVPGHDPERYETRLLHAVADDGEQVPITVLHRKGLVLDGSAPLLLQGYGSYGECLDADFDAGRLSLVDRGFVFALAHVRGGEEKGLAWYLAGKHGAKRNSFTDFIAVGRHLAAAGYTREGRIIASGDSAGGMLVAAAANMAPELFLAVIADVPFVDVLNTMLDAKLPMTPGEWPEWGNPIRSKTDFELIRSYSPYDNVRSQAYPHILAFANLADTRVAYWEPAKWVARVRELKTNDSLVLLKVNMDAGHDGASGRLQQHEEAATALAFALMVAGWDETDGAPATS